MFDDADMDATHEDWQTAVDVHCILNRFADFHPSLLKVVAKATAAKQFPLLYREPIERWTRDYLVLAGDSAHPMLPRKSFVLTSFLHLCVSFSSLRSIAYLNTCH